MKGRTLRRLRRRTRRRLQRLRRSLPERRARLRAVWRARTARLRALPDFVIIGAQKGGTTSLFRYLGTHPDVLPASQKEVHFFDLRHDRGLDHYRSHFPLRGRLRALRWWRKRPVLTGEASPLYLFHPDVPERLREAVPNAKLIVLLRDPVDRAFSDYRMRVRRGRERRSFSQAVTDELERLAIRGPITSGGWYPALRRTPAYVDRGLYADQLERWLAHFPREQLLVLRSADLLADPESTYETALRFLELSTDVPFPDFRAYNRDRPVRRRGETDSELPPEVRGRLEEAFREPNERLAELVGVEFPASASRASSP